MDNAVTKVDVNAVLDQRAWSVLQKLYKLRCCGVKEMCPPGVRIEQQKFFVELPKTQA